jgi:hypothetical protein
MQEIIFSPINLNVPTAEFIPRGAIHLCWCRPTIEAFWPAGHKFCRRPRLLETEPQQLLCDKSPAATAAADPKFIAVQMRPHACQMRERESSQLMREECTAFIGQ